MFFPSQGRITSSILVGVISYKPSKYAVCSFFVFLEKKVLNKITKQNSIFVSCLKNNILKSIQRLLLSIPMNVCIFLQKGSRSISHNFG